MSDSYEIVMGIEVHAELSTESKIFCSCATKFGKEPNTQICPICTGMPGTLPLLNKKVVEFAVKTGLALNCSITKENKFDRKNYFYPDLPKAYQISQLYLPICRNGFIEINSNGKKKKIGIHEIHMEEDAGKLIHDENATLIDYNRCGVPLLEIVSEPHFSNGDEVVAYLTALREILIYIGVSDCKMQEGSMRADINLSVRKRGEKELSTRTEMKNMSSFKEIKRAVEYEAERQISIKQRGERVLQQTIRWDEKKGIGIVMRSKENADDYRYFPEPDIMPVVISDGEIKRIKNLLPELPQQKRQRYISEFGLNDYDASIITSEKELCDLFERTTALCDRPKEVCNMIMGELMRIFSSLGKTAENLNVAPEKLASLINIISEGKINRNIGKDVFEQIYFYNVDPWEYVKENNLLILDDPELTEKTVNEIISENQKSVSDYLSGKQKAKGYLIGLVMKRLKGRADPKSVNEAVDKKLKQLQP